MFYVIHDFVFKLFLFEQGKDVEGDSYSVVVKGVVTGKFNSFTGIL